MLRIRGYARFLVDTCLRRSRRFWDVVRIVAASVSVFGSGLCVAGFAGYDAAHAVSPSLVAGPLPVVDQRQAPWSSQWCRSRSSSKVVDLPVVVVNIPVVTQRQIFMVQSIQQTIEIPQLPSGKVLSSVVQVVDVSWCRG